MKKLFILFLTLIFSVSAVLAEIPTKKLKNPPIGTSKKKRNGSIVQYDKSGKKIGTYKVNNGKYYQVK